MLDRRNPYLQQCVRLNPYSQQWEPVLVFCQPVPAPSLSDTFFQQFAGHLALVLATGVGAAILDELLD